MKLAASLDRNTARSATSSTRAMRFIGLRWAKSGRVPVSLSSALCCAIELQHPALDSRRADRVHPHTQRPDLQGCCASEADDRVLGRDVRGEVLGTAQARHRRGVHHRAAAARDHRREHVLQPEEDPVDVDREHLLEAREGGVDDGGRLALDPGVVEEGVDLRRGSRLAASA